MAGIEQPHQPRQWSSPIWFISPSTALHNISLQRRVHYKHSFN